ncbi:hypothetical protein H5T51_07130, partial [Candidatus Bathyarchaeota archaeon]|nr:hypothetical protein [Candidatus Bathyarchaeota archaeon]
MKAKIRGIYATALTKFLIDNGFKIAQPSKVIQARLNLQENCEPPDIIIKDRYDLQGIIALGTAEAINNFQAIIHENLEDAITRKWKPSVDGIYKGKIISEGDSIFHVKISEDIVGILPKEEVDNKKSEWLLVQVDRRRIGRKNPLLSTRLRIVGKYAILVKGSRGGVSLCIHDLNKRSELCNLGSQLAPEGWGIIWREPAAQASK